jgi:hypothetical protein
MGVMTETERVAEEPAALVSECLSILCHVSGAGGPYDQALVVAIAGPADIGDGAPTEPVPESGPAVGTKLWDCGAVGKI